MTETTDITNVETPDVKSGETTENTPDMGSAETTMVTPDTKSAEITVNTPTAESAATDWLFDRQRKTYSSVKEALDGLGLDWEVEVTETLKGYMPRKGDDPKGEEVIFHENKGIVRSDINIPLSVMGTVYTVIQNKEALGMFESIINKEEVTISNGGVFKNGKRIWIACRLPGEINLGPEKIIRYIIISWSHNGEASLNASFVPYLKGRRISLANMVPGVKSSVAVKHTTKCQERIKASADVMRSALVFFQEFEKVLKSLSEEDLPMEKFEKIINYLYPDKPTTKKDGTTRRESENAKRREFIKSEFTDPTKPFAGSPLALIFADAEAADNGRIRKTKGRSEAEVRLDSTLFGTAARRKNKTFNVILTWDEIEARQRVREERERKVTEKARGGIA